MSPFVEDCTLLVLTKIRVPAGTFVKRAATRVAASAMPTPVRSATSVRTKPLSVLYTTPGTLVTWVGSNLALNAVWKPSRNLSPS